MRMKALAHSNLTSQRIMFQKNSINSTHQHKTKYVTQQLQACRSLLRSNFKVWGKKTWLTRAEMQKNKPGPMRYSTAVQWLCDWWLAGRLKPRFTSLNYLPRMDGSPWELRRRVGWILQMKWWLINLSLRTRKIWLCRWIRSEKIRSFQCLNARLRMWCHEVVGVFSASTLSRLEGRVSDSCERRVRMNPAAFQHRCPVLIHYRLSWTIKGPF